MKKAALIAAAAVFFAAYFAFAGYALVRAFDDWGDWAFCQPDNFSAKLCPQSRQQQHRSQQQ